MDFLTSAKNGTSRRGKTFLINYLQGKRLTQQQAIHAKCYDCDGMGDTGECDIETCSLYPYSQFAPKSACASVSGKKRHFKGKKDTLAEIIPVDPTFKAKETQRIDSTAGRP